MSLDPGRTPNYYTMNLLCHLDSMNPFGSMYTFFVENATRSKVQEAIKKGYVWVNGKHEKASYKIFQGIKFILNYHCATQKRLQRNYLLISFMKMLIYWWLTKLQEWWRIQLMVWTGTLVNGLMHHVEELGGREDDTGDLRPGIVHRLDKDTSGLLVVAKNDHTLAALSAKFAEDVERTYWALVWGNPPEEEP